MGASSSAVAFPIGAGPVVALDPHLLVLAVLVAAWVIDKVLAAVEWVRPTDDDGAADPHAPRAGAGGGPGERGGRRGDPGGSPGETSRPSGAE